jgi:tRNA pseudouridine38-40 synthase
MSLSRKRYVYESSFFFDGEALVYQVAANAFLLRMVRSLVGSMLQFERECRTPGEAADRMGTVLAAKDRSLAGTTAPPKGLFLWNVEYCAKPGTRNISSFSRGIPIGAGPCEAGAGDGGQA